jgi:tetratricopeptide (TPR) repeat protein
VFLQHGDHAAAEENLKKAITDETDATVPLVYLGATYAAAGLDRQAAAAWVTALGQSDDLPSLFEWAAMALMRAHEIPDARDLLEEAVAKWPDDARFARPLALLYATLGRGREALALLERHLTVAPDDKEALMLGVRWYYEVHLAGEAVHEDDLARAQKYADAYEQLGGTEVPLIRQWLGFLARK